MTNTSIIIPTYNGLHLLRDCIGSIRRHTAEAPHEIIVVDNGSTDGTADFCLREQLTFLSLPANIGFPRACNYGLKLAGGDALLLLNNDVLVTRNWLGHLMRCLESSADIGIVGPVTNYASGKQQIDEPFTNMDDAAERFNRFDPDKWKETKRLVGLCFLLKRELLDQVGYLDERFSPGHYEDDDYCLRARQAGYRLMIAGDVFVFHHGSQSFARESEASVKSLLERNRAKFIEKWGEAPERFID